jgi:hypothetical protein
MADTARQPPLRRTHLICFTSSDVTRTVRVNRDFKIYPEQLDILSELPTTELQSCCRFDSVQAR